MMTLTGVGYGDIPVAQNTIEKLVASTAMLTAGGV